MDSQTIRIDVGTLRGLANELDWKQYDDKANAERWGDLMVKVENQGPAGWVEENLDDEQPVVLTLTEEEAEAVQSIIDAITDEYDIDISAGVEPAS